MSAARQISVYPGQDHIGTVIKRSDKSCIAHDVNGREIGTFPDLQKAANAISEVDKIFSGATSKKIA